MRLVSQNCRKLLCPEDCALFLTDLDRFLANEPTAGETTCVLAVVASNRIWGASVGDSGAWVICSNSLFDLTENQQRKPYLGSGSARPILFSHPALAGCTILLATDGLLKYAPRVEIASICRTLGSDQCARQLVELVRYPSGALPDDVTVIVLHL